MPAPRRSRAPAGFSRPALGAHRLQRVALEPRDQLALDSVHLFQEVIDQKRYVVLAFTYSALLNLNSFPANIELNS
jgi:hypothetical protein